MHRAAPSSASLLRELNCLVSSGESASFFCETKASYRDFTWHWGSSEVTRNGEILLTVESLVVFQWEEESARCDKAFSFAVSAFQRFKTIGNTHHLLPKGLLARNRNSFFLLVVFSGT